MVMEVQNRWSALFFKEQVKVYHFISLCIFICLNVNLSFLILSDFSEMYISWVCFGRSVSFPALQTRNCW